MEATATAATSPTSETARTWRTRLGAALPGAGAAVLVVSLGAVDGGYFPTAWAPATLLLLTASAVMLLAEPRARLGVRELAIPTLLLALALWSLGSAAWGTATEAVPEVQRTLVYIAGALAFALAVRTTRPAVLLTGLWAGISVVAVYALATRLFPERLGVFDPFAGYRLSEPVGYWNALGLLASLGILLALGLAARSTALPVRLLAASSTVPLALTLYFTFSRGAWLALVGGLVAMLVADPRRLQLASMLVMTSPWPVAAVLLASSSEALTEKGATLAAASADGHALAAIAAGLGLAAAAAVAIVVALESQVRVSGRTRRFADAGIVVGVAGALAAGVVALGGPSQIGRSFAAPPSSIGADLNKRLFSISGNGRLDHWRVSLKQADEHQAVGGGAGSFKRFWLEHRPTEASVRDAHSLYLEVLGELGPLGLALVLAIFVGPLAYAFRNRGSPFVPVAGGLLVAFGLHAGVDWDWEIPLLTLIALACVATLLAPRREQSATPSAWRRFALLGALAALVPVVGYLGLGSQALAESTRAAEQGDYARSVEEARRAERLTPWSVEPLLRLGRAQVFSGARADARETFRRALEREPGNWRLWLELAAISQGKERVDALDRAHALNPLEDLIADLRSKT